MDNANTKDYLDKIRTQVCENLKRTAFAPSVQMTDVPRNPMVDGMDDEADDVLDDLDEDENKDKRFTQRRWDQFVEKPGELSDSEDEDMNSANGVRRQPGASRRRNQANYRNLEGSGLDSGIATPQEASSVGDGDLDSAMDTNMTDIPRTEPEAAAGTAAASNELGTPADDPMALEGEDKGPSTTASQQQPSPPPQDEDTAMEDAAAPAADEENSSSAAAGAQDANVKTSPDAEEAPKAPLSPPQAGSTPKEASAPAAEQGAEASTEESGPAGAAAPATTATESTETTKQEE